MTRRATPREHIRFMRDGDRRRGGRGGFMRAHYH
jgi:hypothetical protein